MPRGSPRHPRPTLFDTLRPDPQVNAFCERRDLDNEASVEMFFVARLLIELGYRDSQIQTKKSISELAVPLGRSKVNYKPDYVLRVKGKPRWVVDAKSPEESLEPWVSQCSGYCLLLNQQFPDENPVQFFVLTNGILTQVYKWDVGTPHLELDFTDFNIGSPRYGQLRSLLGAAEVASTRGEPETGPHDFLLTRPTAEEAKRIFAQCHKIIWKSELYSPTAAFMEFVKLMFVKLWADRELREDASIRSILDQEGSVRVPQSSVTFSLHWIDGSKAENPVNDILFRQLRDRIERDIALRKKKRIFDQNEAIDMQPDTLKAVVRKLQHCDMFGIDEDLNGRLFETFLSATMRGRELGQYFTPRSIVKLMVQMAHLKATPAHIDRVLDACCGTGGFLIEALAAMRDEVRANESLTLGHKEKLLGTIANESIFGIDFGKRPQIARIARINMYLHGDGGTRIYYADSLDKELVPSVDQDPEVLENQDELRRALEGGLLFDVALTNPPFSMTKELSNDSEARILKRYDLASEPGTVGYRASLRSSEMFIERYRDLLQPGGRLFTVIDDTLLSSKKFERVRAFIRSNFIIRAIVSLPGDAFRRAGARVKTSVLCLERKSDPGDTQPRVYYAFAANIGVDDLPSKASDHDIDQARIRAEDEIRRLAAEFERFLDGDATVASVAPERVRGRLDLKHVVPLQGRLVDNWKARGIEVRALGDVVTVVEDPVVPKEHPDQEYILVGVSYDGMCRAVKKQKGKRLRPPVMYRIRKGDLVFSNIRATDGAIGILPEELDGALASGSYTVLRCETQEDTVYLWSLLRSHELRADLMSVSTGTSRYTVDWQDARQIAIPWIDAGQRDRIAQGFMKAWQLEDQARSCEGVSSAAIAALGVESRESKDRFQAYQPPK